jgi:hypothetical protein
MTIGNDEIRAIWRKAGGGFHGPHVEQAYMEEAKFLLFMRELLEANNREIERRRAAEAKLQKLADPDGEFLEWIENHASAGPAICRKVCLTLAAAFSDA